MGFLAGQNATAAALNAASAVIMGWARRTTISTGSTATTETPVLRLDSIVLSNGISYNIKLLAFPNSTVTSDVARVQIHYNTTGVAASTTDPVLPGGQAYCSGDSNAGGAFQSLMLETEYVPGANQNLSLLVCVSRSSGTGTVTLFADGTRNTEMKVFASGGQVANTGVNM